MNVLSPGIVWTIASILTLSAAAEDWPTYLNGNDRVGATSESLALPLNLQWTYSSPAPPENAWAGPRSAPIEGKEMRHRVAFDRSIDVACVDGWLYFGSSVDHKVYCVNAKTGEPRWEFYTDAPIRLSPTVWENRVYVGS
ncbi:MAG: PQQ-binding-like beta-propeller repeat protein, partial [Pirellulaceae bacterium]|nr:PQQ-binding-like beta-propeller repeat protein [Pirellulaceae bacterium]